MPIRKAIQPEDYDGDNRVIDEFVTKSLTIRKDQDNFIKQLKEKGERFKLSSFVQHSLDKFIRFRKEGEEFVESLKGGEKNNGKK